MIVFLWPWYVQILIVGWVLWVLIIRDIHWGSSLKSTLLEETGKELSDPAGP